MKYPDKYVGVVDKIIPVKVWTRDRLKMNIQQMEACQGHNITYTDIIDSVLDIYEASQGVDYRHPVYHKQKSDVATLTSVLQSAVASFFNPPDGDK